MKTALLSSFLLLAAVSAARAEPRTFSHQAAVRALAFSPDGKQLAVGCQGETIIHLLDVVTGKEVRAIPAAGGAACLAFSPDGKLLASAGLDNNITLWDSTLGKEVRQLKGHEKVVTCVAFAPNGKTLATGSQDETVRLWDVAEGKQIGQIKEAAGINGVAYSPDGKLLGVASWFGEVHLWEPTEPKLVRRCSGHLGALVSVVFSPDGRLLASGGHDASIRLWDLYSGREIRAFEEHQKQINALAFTADGRILLSGSEDRTVRLSDIGGDREVRHGERRTGPVFALAVSGDGRFAAAGGADGKVVVFETATLNRQPRAAVELPARKLESFWNNLGSRNPRQAWAAVWALSAVPRQTIPLLQARLGPFAANLEQQRIARMFLDLNDDRYAVREKASRDLEQLGSVVEPSLQKGLKDASSLESRRRMERLLEKIKAAQSEGVTPEILRALRGIAVLEAIGSPQARVLLEQFARGIPEAQPTQDAKSALARLARLQR